MSETAVVVIDMLNAYQHEDAELLIPNVADVIDPLARLVLVADNASMVGDMLGISDGGQEPPGGCCRPTFHRCVRRFRV